MTEDSDEQYQHQRTLNSTGPLTPVGKKADSPSLTKSLPLAGGIVAAAAMISFPLIAVKTVKAGGEDPYGGNDSDLDGSGLDQADAGDLADCADCTKDPTDSPDVLDFSDPFDSPNDSDSGDNDPGDNDSPSDGNDGDGDYSGGGDGDGDYGWC